MAPSRPRTRKESARFWSAFWQGIYFILAIVFGASGYPTSLGVPGMLVVLGLVISGMAYSRYRGREDVL